jgi:hypothetical protein
MEITLREPGVTVWRNLRRQSKQNGTEPRLHGYA